jgi:pimeloyl-ACP methyl ester carboxylesterase
VAVVRFPLLLVLLWREALDGRDMFALLDSLKLQQVRAMGLSSGGMTLLHMATRQPSRIEAMVLIGATTYFPEQARKILPESLPPLLRGDATKETLHCGSLQGFPRMTTRVRDSSGDLKRDLGR